MENVRVILTFPPQLQELARDIFSAAFSLQMKIVVGFGAAQFLAIALMLKLKLSEGERPKIVGAR